LIDKEIEGERKLSLCLLIRIKTSRFAAGVTLCVTANAKAFAICFNS